MEDETTNDLGNELAFKPFFCVQNRIRSKQSKPHNLKWKAKLLSLCLAPNQSDLCLHIQIDAHISIYVYTYVYRVYIDRPEYDEDN